MPPTSKKGGYLFFGISHWKAPPPLGKVKINLALVFPQKFQKSVQVAGYAVPVTA